MFGTATSYVPSLLPPHTLPRIFSTASFHDDLRQVPAANPNLWRLKLGANFPAATRKWLGPRQRKIANLFAMLNVSPLSPCYIVANEVKLQPNVDVRSQQQCCVPDPLPQLTTPDSKGHRFRWC